MRIRYPSIRFLLFSCLLGQGNVYSEEAISEMDFLAESEAYVSSATRLKQLPRDIPATVSVISREMIEASSASYPVELLRLVPGFQVGCLHANDCTVTYHGVSDEHNTRVHVLLNGRSFYDPMFGGTLWSALPVAMDDIEYIEVIRGPNAAAYGANSFSAVIHIHTYSASYPNANAVSITADDQRNTRRFNLNYAGDADKFSYVSSLEIETNDGFYNSYQDNNDPDPSYIPQPGQLLANFNDSVKNLMFNTRIDFDASSKELHQFDFGFKLSEMGKNFEGLQAYGVTETAADVFSFYGSYTLSRDLSLLESDKLKINLTSHREDFEGRDVDGGQGGNHAASQFPNGGYPVPYDDWSEVFGFKDDDHIFIGDYDFVTHRVDAEYDRTRIFSPQLQVVYGGGLRFDYVDSDSYFNGQDQSRMSFSAHTNAEWKASDNMTVNGGLLFEKYEDIEGLWSPRLAANFHISHQQTLRLNVSRAYRVPSLYDLYANSYQYELNGSIHDWDRLGNPQLDPEQIDSYEIGYLGKYFNDRLAIDLRLAREDITDVIYTRKTKTQAGVNGKRNPDVPEYMSLNYGETDIESAELGISIKPDRKTLMVFNVGYSNSWGYRPNTLIYDGSPTPVDVLATDQNIDEFVPNLTTSVLLSREIFAGAYISAQYSYVDPYTTAGEGDDLDRHESADLKYQQSFKSSSTPIDVWITVKNITDNAYEDFANENLVGREVWGGIKIGL